MKISIKLEGYLKYKYSSGVLELNYSQPVTINKVMEDAEISPADVFFIKAEDQILKGDYVLTKSTEIKLFSIIGGG